MLNRLFNVVIRRLNDLPYAIRGLVEDIPVRALIGVVVVVGALPKLILLSPVAAAGMAGIGLIAWQLRRRRITRIEHDRAEAALTRYIQESLTDETIRWALATWSRRYRR